MKRLSILLVMILGVQTMPAHAGAKVFSGYKRSPTTQTSDLIGPVTDYIVTDHEFKILIGINAAFYSFPKDSDSEVLKRLLEKSKNSKTALKISVDPISRQIFTIQAGE